MINSASPALYLDGVTKRYGEMTAVSELSLTLQRGRVLALLGPNGAGKTTTVEMCEGFIKPDQGTLEVLGMDPTKHKEQLRGRIGIMLQGGGAYPGVKVAEMLELVASYSANPLDVDWLLEVVGLERNRKTNYRRLSGGQQQRLSLACALVGRPELIFLDEPTAGLDAQSRHAVWDLVSSLRRDGVTVVLTTHLMDEAEGLADDVAIIDKGRLVAYGTTEEITSLSRGAEPSGSALKIRIAAPSSAHSLAPSLSQALSQAALPARAHASSDHTLVVEGELTPALISAVARHCEQSQALITELTSASRSLEEVFLELTGKEMKNS